ncbi:bifunctional 5,10-methylenetetrahydrofolate dehydrogenase/5,10-methenyltetrahydrofolate cyclohydrolase [Streptomyces sp. NPDC048248]|uniref:bifunctional 5,10-methylenetetrahydrofolate dehydrogenase/5,10-methenyltetrahydrofolate cyclohydrolase n=1 Tax=Streptomyces sp. NPDC048248 TaxID=3365523 RepID=UPI003711F31E
MSRTARVMDGSDLARRMVERAAERAAEISRRTGQRPCLATVLVGEDPASVTYVRMKRNRCERAGLRSRHVALPASVTQAELIGAITSLSRDPDVHGILLQHPVGPHLDERATFEAIAPEKDVDGVTTHSFAAMSFGLDGFASCAPGGIMRLLEHHDVELAGRRAVVVGRSAILGKPVGMLLLARDATVTYCHSRTADLPSVTREADVLIVAVGRPRALHGDHIRPGAVVIDAGYHPGNVGDVDFDSARRRAGLLTPVPGGVGPMTIATLLTQTVEAAARQLGALGAEAYTGAG